MKTVLLSIQPKWCRKIQYGEKTIEVRKTRPKIDTPFKCYIYMTKKKPYKMTFAGGGKMLLHNGNVIGEFVCDNIDDFHEWELTPSGKYQEYEQERLDKFLKDSCLTYEEVCNYRQNLPYYKPLYAWHINNLKIYDEPKELSEFGITRAPQSWEYVKGDNND